MMRRVMRLTALLLLAWALLIVLGVVAGFRKVGWTRDQMLAIALVDVVGAVAAAIISMEGRP
jgi:hypothetical protein